MNNLHNSSLLIRILSALKRKADTRRRDLEICVPTMVLLTTSVQLVVRSDAFVTFQNIWEHYCKSRNLQKDIVTTTYIEWINKIYSAGSKLERNVSMKSKLVLGIFF